MKKAVAEFLTRFSSGKFDHPKERLQALIELMERHNVFPAGVHGYVRKSANVEMPGYVLALHAEGNSAREREFIRGLQALATDHPVRKLIVEMRGVCIEGIENPNRPADKPAVAGFFTFFTFPAPD